MALETQTNNSSEIAIVKPYELEAALTHKFYHGIESKPITTREAVSVHKEEWDTGLHLQRNFELIREGLKGTKYACESDRNLHEMKKRIDTNYSHEKDEINNILCEWRESEKGNKWVENWYLRREKTAKGIFHKHKVNVDNTEQINSLVEALKGFYCNVFVNGKNIIPDFYLRENGNIVPYCDLQFNNPTFEKGETLEFLVGGSEVEKAEKFLMDRMNENLHN
ncbi:hypothetical protein JXB27_01685 [Candidatus Woesearchaeota archaeon]|nr:hypothetical protein [Candidatus Woesearchaeota archaeon]